MTLDVGSRLAHFEVTGKLGEGGMGQVFQARDTKLGRDVALKLLPPAFVSDEDRLARFQREAEVLASLSHPNIGGIHGLEEEGGKRFLVLELARGTTLAERIARGPLAVRDALVIGQQIATALEAAHERGIVHRDLKPANVLITDDYQVRIMDLGVARLVEESLVVTQPGDFVGSMWYAAPEQFRSGSFGPASDL